MREEKNTIHENENIGEQFQEKTKYYPNKISRGSLNWAKKPKIFKNYSDKIKIELPPPKIKVTKEFTEIINNRKSIRDFSDKPLNLEQLSYLLWSCAGIQRTEHNITYRTAPSAGALYPIETYVVVNKTEYLDNGVYHYAIQNHELELIKTGSFGIPIANAALGQIMCAKSSVTFVFTAIFSRSKWKYKQRAYRYIYLDAGHIAENLGLAVSALNLGGCHIAAIFDDEINKILEIDGIEESAIYLMPVGNLKENRIN